MGAGGLPHPLCRNKRLPSPKTIRQTILRSQRMGMWCVQANVVQGTPIAHAPRRRMPLPTVVPMGLTCPVCLKGNRPNDHPGHTKVAGECRMAPMAANPPRERRTATRVRDYKPDTPAPVAHEDSSGVLPPTAPAPDAPEAEPVPPNY